MDSKLQNVLISKYSFMFLVILNILNSVWIIIYDLQMIKKAQDEFPDDIHTHEKHEGSYAKYWFIACVVIMILNTMISLVALYATKVDKPHLVLCLSVLFSIIALYGSWDKYMKGAITSFLIPFFVSIVGILFASLNISYFYEEHCNIPNAARIKYLAKPTSPTVNTFEESEKLKPIP